ncbi:hypothetical protein GS399_20595 [Pedobacter sp. HMF7647]|uniref:DUF4738 domain-containing protein n=2 Tax=Hufsiella arboris TaxID=2695275 RepID=A0A7K1YFI4_9SPHI|nr:hypothetical protein [Hufsiella arboris]
MKLINLTLIIIIFSTSCGQTVDQNVSSNTLADSSTIKQDAEEENEEPDTRELRKEYISNYSKIEKLDTSFTDKEGKQIHVQTKYYCLFDNAIFVPKQYVWEDTTKTFTTHNYSQDIIIVIDKDTIFNKTITKADFADNLYPELKNYAVLMFPNFSYDKEKNVFDFGYSLTIPITDVGDGWRLIIDKTGNISKTDR